MPKPPNIIRPARLELALPEDERAWVEMHLWSDSEARVPHGAYSRFFQKLLHFYIAQHKAQGLPIRVEARLPEVTSDAPVS